MSGDLQLPAEVRPLWIDGVFTSEFERDTLPLLFASDRIFNEYYDALIQKNQHVSVALEQIRERNAQARQQRADGFWQDCVESLIHCVHLRRCVFEETDYQFSAAQKHCVLSLLNFATFFLKESDQQESMLMRSFDLFKRAEELVNDIRGRNDRLFLRAAVENNFATYFVRRRKQKAAAQRALLALRSWSKLGIKSYDLYFAVQKGGGEAWSNRFDESLKLLKEAMAFAPPLEDETGGEGRPPAPAAPPPNDEDAEMIAPVRFNIQLISSSLGIMEASNIALHHNIAVALVGLRRYKEAVPWCTKAMELATAQSAFLKSNHPIIRTIRSAQQFCDKMSFQTRFSDFRMKQSEFVSDSYRRMQLSITKNAASIAFDQRRRALTRPTTASDAEQPPADPLAKKAGQHPNSRRAAEVYAGAHYEKPPTADTLRTYLKGLSYRQLVEEFGMEGKKKRVPKPPPKRASTAEASSRPEPKTETATTKEASPEKAMTTKEASPKKPASPKKETPSRSASPGSSRSSSRYTSRTPSSQRSRSASASPETSPEKRVKASEPEEKSASSEKQKKSPPPEKTETSAEADPPAAVEPPKPDPPVCTSMSVSSGGHQLSTRRTEAGWIAAIDEDTADVAVGVPLEALGKMENGAEGASDYRWFRKGHTGDWASMADGKVFTPSSDDAGCEIAVEYTPVSTEGVRGSTTRCSLATVCVGPPTVSGLLVEGGNKVGEQVTAKFDYSGGAAGAHRISWSVKKGDASRQVGDSAIYTLREDDVGGTVTLSVTPVRKSGAEGATQQATLSGVVEAVAAAAEPPSPATKEEPSGYGSDAFETDTAASVSAAPSPAKEEKKEEAPASDVETEKPKSANVAAYEDDFEGDD